MPIFRVNGATVHFAHVPKAGGTSVERWLREHGDETFHANRVGHGLPCVPQHFHAELLRYLFGDGWFDFSFAIVRHPETRLLSEYNYRMTHGRQLHSRLPAPSLARWVRKTVRVYRRDPYVYGNHIRPQHEFLLPETEVFRLEDGLDSAIRAVADRLSVPAPSAVPFENRSEPVTEGVDDRTARAVEALYAMDYARFGYERRCS